MLGTLLRAQRGSVHNLKKRHLVRFSFHSVGNCVSVGHVNGLLGMVFFSAGAAKLTGRGGGSRNGRGGGGGGSGRLVEDAIFVTSGLVANQLALGLRAQLRGLAFPSALGFLAERRALGFGGGAGSSADGGTADSFAFGAVSALAHLLGASHRADGFLAVNFAFGTGTRFAVHLALGSGADGMAFGRAHGIIA